MPHTAMFARWLVISLNLPRFVWEGQVSTRHPTDWSVRIWASMTTSRTPISVDLLLDAAERVVLRDGIGRLTLDAVADEAGVSKGGLTYHFASKDRLIEALVGRINEQCRRDHIEAIQAAEPGPGRVPRGLLRMCHDKPAEWQESMRRTSMVLLAAMVSNPELVRPLRESYLEMQRLVREDGLAPGYGEAVLAALDGLWLAWIFGLQDMAGERVETLKRALEDTIARGIERAERPAS
jgi:AcrR family transcriptional regulator